MSTTLDMDLIVVEILPRLPSKSLIRFKSVSKSYQSAISSREFAKLYHRHRALSSDKNDLLILQDVIFISSYDLNSSCTSISIDEFNCNGGLVSIIGSCNGLFCVIVDRYGYFFVVHNPYTHMDHYNPLPVAKRQPGFRLGFAFDHLNFDYKIVAVSDEYDESGVINRFTRVYSLNTCKWNAVDIRGPGDSMEGRQDGALIDDHLLHWIFKNPSSEAKIGCFDVCQMKWTYDVLLPQYYYDPNHNQRPSLLDFGVFDECLFSLFENRVDSRFDIWVMKDYGVQDSWFKFLSIPISDEFVGGIVPITHRARSGEVLIRQRQCSRLYWYNTANGGIRAVKFNGAPDFGNHQVHTCSKSIVDIPRSIRFRNQYLDW